MPVRFKCPECDALLEVKDVSRLGRRVRCGRCRRIIKLDEETLARDGEDTYKVAPLSEEDLKRPKSALPSSELQCARCGEHLESYVLVCPHCGADPMTGTLLEGEAAAKAPLPEGFRGFVKLDLTVLAHPLKTMDRVAHAVLYADTATRMALHYLASLPILAFYLLIRGSLSGQGAPAGDLLRYAGYDLGAIVLSAGMVNILVGWVGGSNYIGILVAFTYLTALVRFLFVAVMMGVALGIVGEFELGFLWHCFGLWAWVLHLLAIRKVYDVSTGLAFGVNVLPALILWAIRIIPSVPRYFGFGHF